MSTRLALVLAALLGAGCAVTSDIVWLASKPQQGTRDLHPDAPTYRGPDAQARRYLDVDVDGSLVCIDEQRRLDRLPTVETTVRTRNGHTPDLYGLAVAVDAMVTFPALYGTAYLAAPLTCDGECEAREQRALLAAGALTLLDMAWGTYRALTVKPTILERASLSYRDAPALVATPCPVDTVIALQGEAGTFELRFGAGGRLAAELVPAFQAFTSGAVEVNIPIDAHIQIDLPGLRDLANRLAPR